MRLTNRRAPASIIFPGQRKNISVRHGRRVGPWVENVLLFDDPDGCCEKIAQLRDAGVQRLLLWMGPGGVKHDLLVRSMRLFAEEVLPQFR